MGVPHYEQNSNKRDTVLIGGWDRGYHTSRYRDPTFCTPNFDNEANEIEQRLNLDLLGIKRERAQVH